MGIFRRISDIIAANVNDLIDKAEDPEKMAKQIIREMEEGIGEVRGQVARAMAAHRQLCTQLESARRGIDEWQQRALRAVELDKDDLARGALVRRHDAESAVRTLAPQVASAQAALDTLREQLKALEDRIMLARRKRDTIIARQRVAAAQQQVHRSVGRFGKADDHLGRMTAMGDRVEELEARVSAEVTLMTDGVRLEDRFEQLKEQTDVEAELAALRQQVHKAKGAGGPSRPKQT